MKLQIFFILLLIMFTTPLVYGMHPCAEQLGIDPDPHELHLSSEVTIEAGIDLLNYCDISPQAVVVVFGCSAGSLAAYIAKNVVSKGKVIGFDCDRTVIDFAKKRYEGIKNLEFKYNFFGVLDEHSVDCVISVNRLNGIADRESVKMVFSEFARCLKRSGWLLMKAAIKHSEENPTPLYQAIVEVAEGKYRKYYEEHIAFINNLNDKDYGNIMVESGLQGSVFVKKSEESECSWDLLKRGLSIFPTICCIPNQFREHFLDDIFTALCKYVPRSSKKSFLIHGTFCEIVARIQR